MNRTQLSIANLIATVTLAACPGSDTDRLERIQTVPVTAPVALGGGGSSSYVGVVDGALGAEQAVRFYRLDPASADTLVGIGGSTVPSFPVSDFTIDGDTAVLVGLDATCLISLVGDVPGTPECYFLASSASLAATDGTRLVVAHGSEIRVLELDPWTASHVVDAFTATAPITGLFRSRGESSAESVVIAFTDAGFVVVDPLSTQPTFTELSHDTIRGFRRAYSDGRLAMAAGPSPHAGMSRVARLDLIQPEAPTVLRYGDFAGEYGAFAWDGGDTSILEVQGEPGAGLYRGYRIVEGADAFGAAEVSLPQWFGGEAHVAAHGGRLFALDEHGMGFYRIH